MTYSINVTGQKLAALAEFKSRLSAERTRLGSAGVEVTDIDEAAKRAEDKVNQHAGDDDTVGISISGHASQSETSFATASSVGVTVTRAASVSPDRAAAITGQPVGGAPAPDSPAANQATGAENVNAARAQAAAASGSGALPTSNGPTGTPAR